MLTDIQKQKIIAFNQDPKMVEAVRKVLLRTLYSEGVVESKLNPVQNRALGLAALSIGGKAVINNERLGEDLRALAQGVFLLEAGFKELAKIKKEEKEEEDKGLNEAT